LFLYYRYLYLNILIHNFINCNLFYEQSEKLHAEIPQYFSLKISVNYLSMSLCIVCLVLFRQARTKTGGAGGHRKVPPSSKHRLEGCSCLRIHSFLHDFGRSVMEWS